MSIVQPRFVLGALALLALGGIALYGTGSNLGNLVGRSAPAPCASSGEAVRRIAPFARGGLAAFDVTQSPRPLPALAFKGPDGAETSLSAMKGRTLLVNLWATWCAPCKAEMPALDRLQAERKGQDFEVVAINVDTRNLDKPPAWLAENGITHLEYYSDPSGRLLPLAQQHAASAGLPTTLLIDAAGCEIGLIKGPADWAGEDARLLVNAALGQGS